MEEALDAVEGLGEGVEFGDEAAELGGSEVGGGGGGGGEGGGGAGEGRVFGGGIGRWGLDAF